MGREVIGIMFGPVLAEIGVLSLLQDDWVGALVDLHGRWLSYFFSEESRDFVSLCI